MPIFMNKNIQDNRFKITEDEMNIILELRRSRTAMISYFIPPGDYQFISNLSSTSANDMLNLSNASVIYAMQANNVPSYVAIEYRKILDETIEEYIQNKIKSEKASISPIFMNIKK